MAQTSIVALTPGWMLPIWEAEEQRTTTRTEKAQAARTAGIPNVPDGCQYAPSCHDCLLPDCMISDSYNGQRLGRLTRQVALIRQAARMGATPAAAVRAAGMPRGVREIAIARRAILSDPDVAESPVKEALRETVMVEWAEEQARKRMKGTWQS